MQALATEVARQVDDMAASRDVMIRIDAAAAPPLIVDPARLELVLLNLVSNGIKYCDPDKADRFIEIAASPDSDGDVHDRHSRQRSGDSRAGSGGHIRAVLPRSRASRWRPRRHGHGIGPGDCRRMCS